MKERWSARSVSQRQRLVELRVDGDRPDALTLAVDPQHPLACGAGHAVHVEGDDLLWAALGDEVAVGRGTGP